MMDVKTRGLVNQFEMATRAHAFRGYKEPSTWPELDEKFQKAKKALKDYILGLEKAQDFGRIVEQLRLKARELCPDYPYKHNTPFEDLWAITSSLEGTRLANGDCHKKIEELEGELRELQSKVT